MSNATTAAQEETFTQRLDIQMITTREYEDMLELFAGQRTVLAAIGPSGIGKTAIPQQVARNRGAPYVALHMPTMSIEDFHIPTTAMDTKQYYDRRIPRKFQELIEYVQGIRKENNGVFPAGKHPILAIEELNRTVDKHVTRATFTLLDDRMIGDTYIDDAIQMVVTMNPSGGSMAVNEFEKDPAMRRRLVMVGVTGSYGDFMKYAKATKFHQAVIDHLEAQPALLYDNEAALAGKKFACPAAWETVSRVCYALDTNERPIMSSAGRAAFSGAIGATATEAMFEFLQDRTVVITPEEVLQGYFEESTVRKRYLKLLADDRQDKISALATSVVVKMYENTNRKADSYAKQLALYLKDMPTERTIAFIRDLFESSKTAHNGNVFLSNFNTLIAKDPNFNECVQRMQAAQQKGQDEAKKSGL